MATPLTCREVCKTIFKPSVYLSMDFGVFHADCQSGPGIVRAKKTGRREGRWGRFPAGEGEENRVFEFSLLVTF
jgi:hypothetical protein